MIANCAFIIALTLFVVVILLLAELAFLAPYRRWIFHQYGWSLAAMFAVLFLNLFALLFLAARWLLLTDTGRKLAHVEKQLRTRDSIVRELSERLAKED